MLLSYLYIPADKYWFLYLPTATAVVGGGVGGASRAALPVGAARAGAGERQERDLVLLLSRLRTPCSATSPIPSDHHHPHTALTCRSPFSLTLSAFSSTELPRLLPGRRYLSVSARSESATWGSVGEVIRRLVTRNHRMDTFYLGFKTFVN